MNTYLLLKTLHILSSVLLVGTGFGTAFYLYMTNRTKNVAAIAEVSRLVVLADWCFTTPAVIIQPISGLAMVYMAGWPITTPWIMLTLVLYAIAGLCWLPVVWLQLKLRDMARQAAASRSELPPLYWRYAKIWEVLGYPAFVAMLVIYWLMVAKPAL